MNILLITRPLSKPWNEGSKNLAYGIAKNIKNHKIHILTRKDFDEKLNKNIITHKIYPEKKSFHITYLEKLKLLMFLLKQKDIDIYHFIYTPEIYSSFLNKLITKLKSKKSIQTIPTKIENIRNIKKLLFADKIVVISDFTKRLLIDNNIKNVIKINTGIDIDYFKPIKKNSNLIKNYKLENKIIILVPIELGDIKNRNIICNLINDINVDNIKFILAYRSNIKSNIKNIINKMLSRLNSDKKIIFIKDPKDIRLIFSISDIVLYPRSSTSKKHEIPMVLIEAMAMEKPIIMWDVPPFNELLSYNDGIKAKNYHDLKNSLVKLIKSKKLRISMGKMARKRVIDNFNIQETSKKYENLYKKLT